MIGFDQDWCFFLPVFEMVGGRYRGIPFAGWCSSTVVSLMIGIVEGYCILSQSMRFCKMQSLQFEFISNYKGSVMGDSPVSSWPIFGPFPGLF